MTSTEIRPFRVDVPQVGQAGLRGRLARTHWIEDLPGTGWERGVPSAYLQDLAAYWAGTFGWRAAEAGLNKYPQFVALIDGQDVNFLHVRSPRLDATSLLPRSSSEATP